MSLTPRAREEAAHITLPTFAVIAARTIDRYAVGESLGSGGIGEVFLAWDTVLKRKVALKMLHKGTAGSEAKDVARILREGRAAAKIEHPNAVAIYDVGEHDGGAHIVMEYIDGRTLRHFIDDPQVPLKSRVRWARDVASALSAAHKKGVIHRDIKPENVMWREIDGVIKVVDFGIARCVTAGGSSAPGSNSAEGGLCGTPAYMAPERTLGERGDALSDQFTWAVFAYELLTGTLPWSQDGGTLQLIRNIAIERAQPPSQRRPDIPRWIDAVILRALAKDPRRRFASMADLVAVLDGAAPPPVVVDVDAVTTPRRRAAREANAEQLRRSLRRYRLATAALVPLALGALVAMAGLGALGHDVAGSRSPARPPVVLSQKAAMLPGSSPGDVSPSSNAEATDAYRAGLLAVHDATAAVARRSFERAATLDPSFAAAHLRAVLASPVVSTAERAHFVKAVQLRDTLSEHDRDLLRAIEPWVSVPRDVEETERRIAALDESRHASHADADYRYQLCHVQLLGGRYAEAVDSCRAARDADPTFAGAAWLEGLAQLLGGDTPAGIASIHECLRLAPAAASCLNDLLQLDATDGRCASALEDAEHLVDLDPDNEAWFAALAAAKYAAGSPFAEVHRAFERAWQLSPVDTMPLVQARMQVDEAILLGGFGDAVRQLDTWDRIVARSVEDDEHGEAFRVRAWYEREVGREATFVPRARAFLASRAAWSPERSGGASIDAEIVLYRAGALSRHDFAAARSAWLQGERGRGTPSLDGGVGHRWVTAYATAVVTPEDAREALAALATFPPLPPARVRGVRVDEPVGATYLLAGRADEAIPFLRHAAASCTAALYPFHHTWANLELGIALESTDVKGACDAYGVVVERWGAFPGSRSGRHARDRRKALGCR